MTKAEVFLILANMYLAINLRNKPVSIAIMSAFYCLLTIIAWRN